MKGVDTNILVRFLTGDDEVQTNKVYKIFKNAELEKKELFVSLLVILELIWVLESAYNISRDEVLESINDLISMPIFKFESFPTLQQFINVARDSNYDLSDVLIAYSAKFQGCKSTLTFDKKASKLSAFELA